MKVTIEYCVKWNHLPKAASLAETLEKELGVAPELIKGDGGVFIVVADGEQVFSRLEAGRFPEHEEIIESLKARR